MVSGELPLVSITFVVCNNNLLTIIFQLLLYYYNIFILYFNYNNM